VAKGIQNRLIFYKKLLEKITKIHKPGSPEFYRAFMRLFDEDGLHDGIPGGAHHRALEYFGLDVSLRPEDRLILNHILCEIVFGELPRGRKRGSGESWPQLRRMQEYESFPTGFLLGPNSRAWRVADVEEWLAGRPTSSSPQAKERAQRSVLVRQAKRKAV
jgi:predicted DNA-binding transcriptional regulator AlpA